MEEWDCWSKSRCLKLRSWVSRNWRPYQRNGSWRNLVSILNNFSARSHKSIGGYLKNDGYNSQLKPPLSEANRIKTLAFANRWISNGFRAFDNVIWTDETRVTSNPNNRRTSVMTTAVDAPVQVKMHSGGNSVMYWGYVEAWIRSKSWLMQVVIQQNLLSRF